jgi:zinc transport system substrate-binding protein
MPIKKILSVLISIILLASLFFLVFEKNKEISTSSKLQVTASFYPMYFFASQIGGNKVNVINITPSGNEPHDYDLTSKDLVKIENSKLLILNGLIEPWSNKITDDLKNKNTPIVIAGNKLFTSTDPHVWLSPTLAKIESENIASTLKTIDPLNSDYYNTNEVKLEDELNILDQKYKDGLQNCATRNFVTSHAAFGYLAKDYGLNQIAVSGLSPDEEPSLKKLADVSNFAKENNIKYIFFESLVSPKLSETIANEVGAKTLVLDPIEGVKDNNTYLTLMMNNLQNLRVALQCK